VADIGEKLRLARVEAGMTVREAAEASGRSKDSVSKIERGLQAPTPLTVGKLARAYGVSSVEFLADIPRKKVSAPPPGQRSFENHLAEERRAHETSRELEDLKSFVSDRVDRWEAAAHGEVYPYINIDHGYSIDVWMDATALIGWLGTLRRRAEEELPPEATASVQREIVALIDRIENVATAIHSLANAAAGITSETPQEEAIRRMDERAQVMRRVKMPPDHTDQLDELRRREEEGRKHAAEARGRAAGE
jgi:transcriptional regulator with XRE-family HTH domain